MKQVTYDTCIDLRGTKPLVGVGRDQPKYIFLNLSKTRMHSSRMRTARSLTISRNMLCFVGGGAWSQRAWSQGGLVSGGSGLRGVWSQGGACSRGCVPGPGGAWSGRCLLLGGCLVPGGSAPRGEVVSQHALRQPRSCGQNS